MKTRCFNKNVRSYKDYGARGVAVCARWLESFANFISDMGQPPTTSHTIDRIDADGNYEPGNCRWATPVEQVRNRKNTRLLEYRGRQMPLAAVAEEVGVSYDALFYRAVTKGLSADLAILEALS